MPILPWDFCAGERVLLRRAEAQASGALLLLQVRRKAAEGLRPDGVLLFHTKVVICCAIWTYRTTLVG